MFYPGDSGEACPRQGLMYGSPLKGSEVHFSIALHHGLCHVLGGTAGVPHGIANSIILPHAMRFNLNAAAPELVQVAEAMGIAHAGQSAAEEAIPGLSPTRHRLKRCCEQRGNEILHVVIKHYFPVRRATTGANASVCSSNTAMYEIPYCSRRICKSSLI
jgi:Iron-containing alcohol dehydrogenase